MVYKCYPEVAFVNTLGRRCPGLGLNPFLPLSSISVSYPFEKIEEALFGPACLVEKALAVEVVGFGT